MSRGPGRGRLAQALRKLIQFSVIVFMVYAAFGGAWRNLKVAHNNERLVNAQNFLWEAIYPQKDSVPTYNISGRYVVKFFEAGAWRTVEIDDRVPCDADGKCLLPTSSVAGELWPWLLSKAVFKVYARAAGSTPLPPLSMNLIPTLLGWFTSCLVDHVSVAPKEVKSTLWTAITSCIQLDDISKKKKKRSKPKPKEPEESPADATQSQPSSRPNTQSSKGSRPNTSKGSRPNTSKGSRPSTAASKNGKKKKAEPEPEPEPEPEELSEFAAPSRGIVVSCLKPGLLGVQDGVLCTVVRARKKGSRIREVRKRVFRIVCFGAVDIDLLINVAGVCCYRYWSGVLTIQQYGGTACCKSLGSWQRTKMALYCLQMLWVSSKKNPLSFCNNWLV